MKKIIIALTFAATLFSYQLLSACSCFPTSNQFCGTMIEAEQWTGFETHTIFQAVKTADYYHGMTMDVTDEILGGTQPEEVIVWGDPGWLCRWYTSGFAVGDTFVIKVGIIQNLWPDLPEEEIGDYELGACGVYILPVVDGQVTGNISSGISSMGYGSFKQWLLSGNYQTECENHNTIELKAMLEGPYDASTGLMRTDLMEEGLLPVNQPFSGDPWYYTGNETLSADAPSNIVDWVLVEYRSLEDNNVVVGQKAALLLDNGAIVDPIPTSSNNYAGISIDAVQLNFAYAMYFAIKARNHLAILSRYEVYMPSWGPYDFTQSDNVLGNTEQLAEVTDNVYALKAGDFNADGVITVQDYNLYTNDVSNINEYLPGDLNLDSAVTVADFNAYKPNASAIGVSQIRY